MRNIGSWIRPSTNPPLLSHIPYCLQQPSPAPSSLSDTPPTPPLFETASQHPSSSPRRPQQLSPATPSRPKHFCRHQLTQTQLLEMEDEVAPMEQEKIETSSWCSLDLCLSDPISLPSESQPNNDAPGPISETILSRSAPVREGSRPMSCASPIRCSSDTAAAASASFPKQMSSAVPVRSASECPPPTPVIITPPSSPADTGPPLKRMPSLVLPDGAASENQLPLAASPIEGPPLATKPKIKAKKRFSQKSSSSIPQKRPRPSVTNGLLFESVTFLLTGFSGSALAEQRHELVETIKSLGGHISQSDSVSECVNLHDENDSLVRIVIVNDIWKQTWTTKIFYTLLRGVPAVDMGWIEECRRQNQIVPLQPCAGPYGNAFLRGNAHYPKERRQRPLSGRRIAYFGINKDEFVSILHAGGAIALRQQSKADLIILGDRDLQSSAMRNRIVQAKQAQIPVVNLQWLKDAATMQSFPNVRQSPHRLDINI